MEAWEWGAGCYCRVVLPDCYCRVVPDCYCRKTAPVVQFKNRRSCTTVTATEVVPKWYCSSFRTITVQLQYHPSTGGAAHHVPRPCPPMFLAPGPHVPCSWPPSPLNLTLTPYPCRCRCCGDQVPHHEAVGPCQARHLTQQLWAGEEFWMQVDSHMR